MSNSKYGEKIVVPKRWTGLKSELARRAKSIQVDDSDPEKYVVFMVDDQTVYETTIWRGAVPWSVAGDYSQIENDADRADLEANYAVFANRPEQVQFTDPRWIRKFGNLTSVATAEVLVSARPYNEPASAAQRSVRSTSANDSAAGSGAQVVRLVYLDNDYVQKQIDLTLAGTTPVPTGVSDIRFVEDFFVVRGSVAAGGIDLFPTTAGTGTAITGIGSFTTSAFLCHHYVPKGKRCYVREWGGVCSDDVNFKLTGQARFGPLGADLVDQVIDLDNLIGITANARAEFKRQEMVGVVLGERTRIRVTAVPGQTSSTVTRAYMYLWEDVT